MYKCDSCKWLQHDRSTGSYDCLKEEEFTDAEYDEFIDNFACMNKCSHYEEQVDDFPTLEPFLGFLPNRKDN